MHNYFFIILACVVTIQVHADVLVTHRIDNTLSLINEELVASTITEKSKLEAYQYKDLSYLAIDHEELNNVIEYLIASNLPNLNYKISYYFYDSVTLSSCAIGNYYCNSVQLKITISYKDKAYEGEFRYEPIPI